MTSSCVCIESKPKAYGEVDIKDRVDGADLLQAAIEAGQVRGSSGCGDALQLCDCLQPEMSVVG